MRLFLSLLFCLAPAMAQTSIPIRNASFSNYNTLGYSCGSGCAYNLGPIPSWTTITGNGGYAGSFEASSAQYSSTPPGGGVIAWTDNATISQDLGSSNTPVPNATYTFSVYVGNRADASYATSVTMSLYAGTTPLCTQTINSGAIAAGTFALETLTCNTGASPPSGDLIIQLSSTGQQGNFSAVSLSYTLNQVSVNLTWNWPTTYNVFRATSSQGASCPSTSSTSYTQIATNVAANPANTWTDATVTAGQTYCYYAIVSVAGYASTPSKTVQVTVP